MYIITGSGLEGSGGEGSGGVDCEGRGGINFEVFEHR